MSDLTPEHIADKFLTWCICYVPTSKARQERLENAIRAAEARGYREGLAKAAGIALRYQHINTPREGGDALDRIARYSNATCDRIAADIRAEMEREGTDP